MDESGREGERPWWISAVSHSCCAIAGAAVAVIVVAATIGLRPHEKLVRVPVYREVPATTPANVPSHNAPAGQVTQARKGQSPAGHDAPARELPPLSPGAVVGLPMMGRPSAPAKPAAGVKLKARAAETVQGRRDQPAKPAEPPSPLIEGLAAAERGEMERAIELLERAAAENPSDPRPLICLAWLYDRRMTSSETAEEAERWRLLASEARRKAVGLLQPQGGTEPPEGSR